MEWNTQNEDCVTGDMIRQRWRKLSSVCVDLGEKWRINVLLPREAIYLSARLIGTWTVIGKRVAKLAFFGLS